MPTTPLSSITSYSGATQCGPFETETLSGVAGGFAAVMLGIGILSLVSTVVWMLLMRPARGP